MLPKYGIIQSRPPLHFESIFQPGCGNISPTLPTNVQSIFYLNQLSQGHFQQRPLSNGQLIFHPHFGYIQTQSPPNFQQDPYSDEQLNTKSEIDEALDTLEVVEILE